MLKFTLKIHNNISIEHYSKLIAFIKKQSVRYKSKRSRVLLNGEIQKYRNKAPDYEYLTSKVILVVGIAGGARREELCNILATDVTEHDSKMFLVKLNKAKTHITRSFTITDDFCKIVKKYTVLRPKNCINKIEMVPKQIAIYLNLANPELYTSHTFRRTSATLLADVGADLTTLSRHGDWKSHQVAQSYIEDSVGSKRRIGEKIAQDIHIAEENNSSIIVSKETEMSEKSNLVINVDQMSSVTEPTASSSQMNICATTTKNNDDTINSNDLSQSSKINGPLKNIYLNFNNCSNITFNFNDKQL